MSVDRNKIVAIFGDTMLWLNSSHTKIPNINLKHANPKYRMPFCHQSVFTKTSLLKAHKFDTSFRICADNDFFTKIYDRNFWHIDMVVSIYNAYGISSKPSLLFFKEELKIGLRRNRFYFFTFGIKYLIMVAKYCVKSALPHTLSIKLQSKYHAK